MPRRNRRKEIARGEVGVYHLSGRCVQQRMLFGVDPLTGKDYSYRREWITRMLELLAGLFSIEVGFRSEMSNHFHLVARTRPDLVNGLSDEEVVRRMLMINRLTRNMAGELEPPDERRVLAELQNKEKVAKYRVRLSDPSWLMKALRENISRRANSEDGTKGPFWDGRFRCRRLEDEAAILICAIYVDLNQIRAGEARTPEESRHTSVYDRIESWRALQLVAAGELTWDEVVGRLPDGWMAELTLDERHAGSEERGCRSRTGRRASDKGMLNIRLEEYLGLLDWSGRILREGAASIPAELRPILDRLQIDPLLWETLVRQYDAPHGTFCGDMDEIRRRVDAKVGRLSGGALVAHER